MWCVCVCVYIIYNVCHFFIDDRFIFAMEDKFYLQLYSPTAWEPIPNARLIHYSISNSQDSYSLSSRFRFDMARFDRVVSMKVMQLRSQETASGRKEYIVMGTTSVCGEEVQCKGKVCVLREKVHILSGKGSSFPPPPSRSSYLK